VKQKVISGQQSEFIGRHQHLVAYSLLIEVGAPHIVVVIHKMMVSRQHLQYHSNGKYDLLNEIDALVGTGGVLLDFWKIERELRAAGNEAICGLDEAGRGPLAGAVYAAAVILPFEFDIPGLDDSKKLTAKKRNELFNIIINSAVSFAVASADQKEIDEINILNATYLAMNRALDALSLKPTMSLVDGNRSSGITHENRCVIHGDRLSASIAAASILAKVSRDRYMLEMADMYPRYAFEKHKGYGTKLHYERLREYGPCELHRISFLRKLKAEKCNKQA
jgi:ribonuclease HII